MNCRGTPNPDWSYVRNEIRLFETVQWPLVSLCRGDCRVAISLFQIKELAVHQFNTGQ